MNQTIVQAQRFEVVDEDGKVQAAFGRLGDSTVLAIFGADGKPVLSIGLLAPGEPPSLMMSEEGAQARMLIGLRPDGQPDILLFDDEGVIRLSLGLGYDGHPGLELAGKDGATRADFKSDVGDSAGITLSDSAGENRLSMGLFPFSGVPEVNLSDAMGRNRIKIGFTPDESSQISLFDEDGNVVRE